MKCSFGISDFLEEIPSLSHSVVFLYIFAEEGFLISSCYSLELCIQMLVSFLFSFAFCFSSFHITICKIESQWEFAVGLREPKQGLCINLDAWDGEGGRKEFQEGGDICIPMADSC